MYTVIQLMMVISLDCVLRELFQYLTLDMKITLVNFTCPLLPVPVIVILLLTDIVIETDSSSRS